MNTYVYYSQEEEVYNSKYKGHFNKKLAEWAIDNMRKENPSTGALEPIKRKTFDEYDKFVKENKIDIPEESYFDGYYILNMLTADYSKSLEDDKHKAAYIEETICDPDCEPTAVLACFKAKMDIMDKPIFWEKFL